MPNWTFNRITISKSVPEEAYREFLDAVKTPALKGEGNLPLPAEEARSSCFDFEAIIPMPKELNVISGTESDMALALIEIQKKWVPSLAEFVIANGYQDIFSGDEESIRKQYRDICKLVHPDVYKDTDVAAEAMRSLKSKYEEAMGSHPVDGTKKFFETAYSSEKKDYLSNHFKRREKELGIEPHSYGALDLFLETEEGKHLLSFGEQLTENIRLYNAPTWYEWACEHWGTKWNAADASLNEKDRTITFDTAWVPPEGIINAIAEKFPDLDWIWEFRGEFGEHVGFYTHVNGVLDIHDIPDASSEAYAMYVEICGPYKCLAQDKDGNWFHYGCKETCPHYIECGPEDDFVEDEAS